MGKIKRIHIAIKEFSRRKACEDFAISGEMSIFAPQLKNEARRWQIT